MTVDITSPGTLVLLTSHPISNLSLLTPTHLLSSSSENGSSDFCEIQYEPSTKCAHVKSLKGLVLVNGRFCKEGQQLKHHDQLSVGADTYRFDYHNITNSLAPHTPQQPYPRPPLKCPPAPKPNRIRRWLDSDSRNVTGISSFRKLILTNSPNRKNEIPTSSSSPILSRKILIFKDVDDSPPSSPTPLKRTFEICKEKRTQPIKTTSNEDNKAKNEEIVVKPSIVESKLPPATSSTVISTSPLSTSKVIEKNIKSKVNKHGKTNQVKKSKSRKKTKAKVKKLASSLESQVPNESEEGGVHKYNLRRRSKTTPVKYTK